MFTVLDVYQRFWHVELDTESSHLTTFNSPFGRYRFKRLPFGISSASEVFQRRMHEVIEGLHGCEVIADDFLVVGYGETEEMGIRDHDRNLRAFLDRCVERDLHLNVDKIQLRVNEVPFIGHTATAQGLKPGPGKVDAITMMPAPTDATGVRRFLGMVQYLEKFMPHLTQLTSPLRELTRKDVPWCWHEEHDNAFVANKQVQHQHHYFKTINQLHMRLVQCSMQKPVYASKALDKLNHGLLFSIIRERECPNYIIRILAYWYEQQKMFIKWGNDMSELFIVTNGVRQGGIISPKLFNMYIDKLNECDVGCCFNNSVVNHLYYADDLCLLLPSVHGLRELLSVT